MEYYLAGPTATVVVAPSSTAIYTGLAITGASSPIPMLYAADGANRKIDVFNGSFAPVTILPPMHLSNPGLPTGYVPLNVEDIGGKVCVTYALARGPPAQDGALAGQGAVAVFGEAGHFIQQLVGVTKTGTGELASPWGMAIAPAGFGPFGGDLLVGNFAPPERNQRLRSDDRGVQGHDPSQRRRGNTAGGLWDLMFGGGGVPTTTR